MNSKLIVFFAIIAAVFAEEMEMKMDEEMKKEEPVEMPEPAKFPPGVDEKLCPDYPNCDNLLLHTPTVDVVRSIKIKGDLPVETVIPGAYPYSFNPYFGERTLLESTLAASGIVAPGLVAPGLIAPDMVAPRLIAPGMVAPTFADPRIAYPGLTPRILVNNMW